MKPKIKLKKFLAEIIIAALIFNSCGYILLYFTSSQYVKYLVSEKLSKNELDSELIFISISKADLAKNKISFEWIHSREFRYNGKMYDIKKNLSDKDSLRFLCYYDEKENLIVELFNIFSKSERENNKLRNSLNLFSFLIVFFEDNLIFRQFFQSTNLPIVLIENPLQRSLKVLTPPPKFQFV